MKNVAQIFTLITLFLSIMPVQSFAFLAQVPDVTRVGRQAIYDFAVAKNNSGKAIVRDLQKEKVRRAKLTASRAGQWNAQRIMQYNKRWMLASRGGFENAPSIQMEATAYDPGPISCGPHATGHTATGMLAQYGVVAVDPRVIPLGTHLYVEGYGYALAADTGSAIKGNRIDLFYNTYAEAIRYGRRMIRVYILGR